MNTGNLRKIIYFLWFLFCVETIFTQNGSSMSHIWLPTAEKSETTVVNDFLHSLKGKMRLLVCRYEGNKLVSTYTVISNL